MLALHCGLKTGIQFRMDSVKVAHKRTMFFKYFASNFLQTFIFKMRFLDFIRESTISV